MSRSRRGKRKRDRGSRPKPPKPDSKVTDDVLLERARREAEAAEKERERLRRIAEVEAADRRWARESGRRSKGSEGP